MSIGIDSWETPSSRPTTWSADGGKKTQTREAMVTGYSTPEEAAMQAVFGPVPVIPPVIPFNPITFDPPLVLKRINPTPTENVLVWNITGEYEALALDDSGNPISWTFSGTTSGATTTITQGIGYTRYGTGPDYQGAINVDKDGVSGIEIVIPKLEFQIEKVIPNGTPQFAYLMTLLALTGTVNNAPAFNGFAAGELLFLGADFSQKGGGDVTFTYKFSASPNRSVANGNALTIGSITNIEKAGHDYLWVDYEAKEVGSYVIRSPRTVHVHKVYENGDFSLLGI